MAKRFTKPTINWVEFEKRVPPEQKAKFLAFKAKADVYLRRVQANPPEPPKIDWDMYQKIVPVSGLVDNFKTAYQQLKIPYPADCLSTKVDEQWKTLEPEIKKYCDEMQKDIDVAKKELNRLNALPKVEDITLEMYYDLYPNDALDPINRPTMWPHTPEEQLDYKPPEKKVEDQKKK
ncbi:H+ transporting ATP synthase subunit d [Danaus plexippus plexippus]|uniref:ATP synthase subunit d, mitochondrial n=1 Tax=Danaus plexippus plexippus TaxID=278856 RepID=A0A212ENK7_DANPL|nr:H+ transporting ATP synthase subunit d [Danaus plexippus plexippus]